MLSAVQRLNSRIGRSRMIGFLRSCHSALHCAASLANSRASTSHTSHWQRLACRQTAVRQLAEYEKDVREAREQIGPLQQGIEGQLQAMKVRMILNLQGSLPQLVEEIPGQGSLEGCHRMFAAMHLIYSLESVQWMNE